MAFEASFSYVQLGTSTLVLTDTSTGVDATITERRIFLYKYDNTTIVPEGTTTEYIVWDISDSTISLTDILDSDYALDIVVIWVTATPDPDNTYEYEILTVTYYYAMTFATSLIAQKQARYPNIVNDNNFDLNNFKLLTYIKSAQNAITVIQNIYLSQASIDLATNMRNNPKYFF